MKSKKRAAKSEKREATAVKQTAPKVRVSSGERWPGKCPKCSASLECYARTVSTGSGKRTKYIRCVKRCGFKTQIFEEIRGPMPATSETNSPRSEPEEATKVQGDFTPAAVKSEAGA